MGSQGLVLQLGAPRGKGLGAVRGPTEPLLVQVHGAPRLGRGSRLLQPAGGVTRDQASGVGAGKPPLPGMDAASLPALTGPGPSPAPPPQPPHRLRVCKPTVDRADRAGASGATSLARKSHRRGQRPFLPASWVEPMSPLRLPSQGPGEGGHPTTAPPAHLGGSGSLPIHAQAGHPESPICRHCGPSAFVGWRRMRRTQGPRSCARRPLWAGSREEEWSCEGRMELPCAPASPGSTEVHPLPPPTKAWPPEAQPPGPRGRGGAAAGGRKAGRRPLPVRGLPARAPRPV